MGLLDNLRKALSSGKVDVQQRFELLREAISGTMSKFYMARDRGSGEVVGLKLLDKEKLANFEARFKGMNKPGEGEITASLDHPNIVKTLEYGTTTRGEKFLVMEFISGPGLNSLIIGRSNDVLAGIRVELIRQIGRALEAVHDAGYIHRDICPRNVMIEPEAGVLKLIDFGLAVPATPPFMQPGNRTGTPNYMAPELVRRQKTDQRLDVFSFGVTAFEMLTFDLPWERGTDGRAAMAHAATPPREILSYRPDLDPRLAEAIMSCIQPSLDDRCGSMKQFLDKIQKVESESVG